MRGAVEARSAACCHKDGPFKATYWWRGRSRRRRSGGSLSRRRVDRLPELEAWVDREHPHEVPEWVTAPVTGGSEAYLKWVVEETSPR
ncbi:divalent cation tolerance protein CutA [Streptomyces sp. NPDC001436]